MGIAMALIEVLDPTSRTRTGELPLAERLADLHNRSVAFYDNGKWNAGPLLDNIAGAIKEDVPGVHAVPCEHEAVLDHYAADAATTPYFEKLSLYDAVVIGIGD
jgi:hypothetical protein